MQEVGKLLGHTLKATGIAGLSHSRLFYITDTIYNHRFLIDTGAEVSILPATSVERRQQQADFSLVAVNGASIPTFGKCSISLNLGLRRTFRWVFVIANVHISIIEADFLCHYNLLVDLVGPVLLSQGCRYLLKCVDRFTRWPEAIPLLDSTAETAAHAFLMAGFHNLEFLQSLLLTEVSSLNLLSGRTS